VSAAFALDPRLAAGSVPITDWPLSAVRLKDDARFHWLLLVPRRPALRELTDLEPADYATLCAEILAASRLVLEIAKPDKLNTAALGNLVGQLHLHVVGRRRDDPAWPDPIWCHGAGPALPPAELAGLVQRYAAAAARLRPGPGSQAGPAC
jgi:diadenosine tetraphosphate (Ap4A) HIT family hydrolase